MNNADIFNFLYVVVLMVGGYSLYTANKKPEKLIMSNNFRVSKENGILKDREGLTKYKQKFYIIYGSVCCVTAIFALTQAMSSFVFCVILLLFNIVTHIVDSVQIKKFYEPKKKK